MGIDHKRFFLRKKNYTCNKGVERQYALLVCVHFIRLDVEVKFDKRPCGTAVFLNKEKD